LPNQGGNASLLSSADTGRTVEQGRDFLIELDGDLVNVFGPQALKFLDRPWNRQRSLKATTIQFNFVSFDDLVPYLCRIKQTFPNLVNFEFLETDIRSMGQLNALAIVQGISSLIIGKEGNPITLAAIAVVRV
jgi:leucine-rich repeat-containing protein 49